MSAPDRSLHQHSIGSSLVNTEAMRKQSELFRADCSRLILETDKECKRMQNYDNKRIDQRVRDIQFLKNELELKLEEIVVDIDVLLALQSRVEKALEACRELLKVTMVCLEERIKRLPPERTHDEVDRELLKEREVFEGVASLLQSVVGQIAEQIRLDRSAKYHLEQDLKEKFEAQCIDNACALMTTHSISNPERSTKDNLPSLVVTPTQWQNVSYLNMSKAEQQQTNSLALRALVESLLKQTAADMRKQVKATTAALELNVQDIRSAKTQLEDQLDKILSELASQKRTKDDLQFAVAESENALGLVQARLALRHQRPGKEQCHDTAQAQLLTEVQQLVFHSSKLREAAAHSEEEQRALTRCQLELQESVDMKASALYTDEVICTQHREPMVIYDF